MRLGPGSNYTSGVDTDLNSEARPPTSGRDYTERLFRLERVPWKQVLNVQLPYKIFLQRLRPGKTLEIGCGIGRNLQNLQPYVGVGVDHNQASVELAKQRGFDAYLPVDFFKSDRAVERSFDSLLLSHVLEHLSLGESMELFNSYLKYLKVGGNVICIVPQEKGYESDSTHVRFLEKKEIFEIFSHFNIEPQRAQSFPFPRWVGKFFKYNETVVVGKNTK